MRDGYVLAVNRGRLAYALAAVVVGGCFSQHGRDDGGAPLDEVPADVCRIGVHQACTPGCPSCTDDSRCDELTEVCQERPRPGESHAGSCTYLADAPSMYEAFYYCRGGAICATDLSALPPGYLLGGRCVHPSYCDEAAEHGIELTCVYSDLSLFGEGPPSEDPAECEGGPARGGLCGPYCENDGCPYIEPHWPLGDPYAWSSSCVGVNEERGIGACALGERVCTPEQGDYSPLEFLEFWFEDDDFLCLNLRDPGGAWADLAWPVFAETCHLYTERYPDSARCLDERWQPVP